MVAQIERLVLEQEYFVMTMPPPPHCPDAASVQ